MSDTSNSESISSQQSVAVEPPLSPSSSINEPPPSFVKLAMRNMVKKGGKSLFHFTLTSVGLLAVLVGLAYITR